MEQVVLKPQKQPEKLCLLVENPQGQGGPSISDLLTKAYVTSLPPRNILETIQNNDTLREMTVADYMAQNGRIWHREKWYILEDDHTWLRLIQKHHETALPGHLGRVKTFCLLDRQYS